MLKNIMIKFVICLTVIAFLSGCSSYKMKLGKKCVDSEDGGQTWSYVWFVKNKLQFGTCLEI
tara:strand:- start:12 stop:197 length:186 start_codon:yes stop_codon:yes gene_type:complete